MIPTFHPFRSLDSGGCYIDAESRLHIVRRATIEELRQILDLAPEDLQKTVRQAAERRLRKLTKPH